MKKLLIICLLTFTSVSIAQDRINTVTKDSVKKTRFEVINTNTTAIPFTTIINKDSINQSEVKTKTTFIKMQNVEENIIVSTTEKLNAEVYSELISTMIEEHKTEYGKTLFIKAPGYKTFRKKITSP